MNTDHNLLRCFCVDDEPHGLTVLQHFIEKIPFLTCVGTSTDAVAALDFLQNHPVDVLFLDIQMPDLNGFALIKRLIHPPMIIFTTAYTDFAVKAFEVNAIDYLLKPFPLERFQKAVEKAKFYFEQVYLKQREESVFVKYDAQRHKIVQANILYIEGFDDYIKIYTHHAPRPILVLESLRKILPRLNPQYFVRLHRSYIVNTRHISSISKTNVVIEGKEIPIGETFKEDFLGKVGKK